MNPHSQDPDDQAELEALRRLGASLMMPKNKRGWKWGKGAGLGLTGEKLGAAHANALHGDRLLQSTQCQMLAVAIAKELKERQARLHIQRAGF